ncbi:MAG TPA: hypothetical protein VNZ44_09130 [Pyrinomonadaceae bacterium]|nr:hypothetical protein [Pyrinomonadaceae bacterium]
MIRLFRKLQDIYCDLARLREDLERLPGQCCCEEGGWSEGECRCGRRRGELLREAASQCADYRPHLDRLREDVRAFESDMRQEGCRLLAGELGWDLLRAEAAVGGIRSLVEEIAGELDDLGAGCASEALGRLRRKGEVLELRLRELGDSMSDPASRTAKWMPLRLVKNGAADRARPVTSVGGAGEDGPVTLESLREIVRRHEVCYEVSPEWASLWGAKTQIGYRLELCGINEHDEASGDEHPTPGCPRCRRTYGDLRKVAEWVMPKEEERASRYEVEPFDRAWHVAPTHRRSRNEIVLAVKVLHRRGVNEPADECERRCLKEMRAGLEELGAGEGKYRAGLAGAGAAS